MALFFGESPGQNIESNSRTGRIALLPRLLSMARGPGFLYGGSQGEFRAVLSMNPLTARAIYCVGLCFLTACAVLPEPPPVAPPVMTGMAPPTVAQQLAAATRTRIEAERRHGSNHPEAMKAIAVETTLRNYVLSLAEQRDLHSEVVTALSNELAAAMALRARASARYGAEHPEMLRAEAVVRELTVALNTEVRGHT
jgi:hypothetical protein